MSRSTNLNEWRVRLFIWGGMPGGVVPFTVSRNDAVGAFSGDRGVARCRRTGGKKNGGDPDPRFQMLKIDQLFLLEIPNERGKIEPLSNL